mmetsp:Transcript_2931/g.3350  ORF Transcript_2931/g.3350 Transcript_2931/m.3350 type:complete len:194 (+) Transcript_2931:231-812(+)
MENPCALPEYAQPLVVTNSAGEVSTQKHFDTQNSIVERKIETYRFPSQQATYHLGGSEVVTEKAKSLNVLQLSFLKVGTSGGSLGSLIVPKKIRLSHLMGGTTLDFSFSRFVHPETKIYNSTSLGKVEIVVPLGVRVVTKNYGILTKTKNEARSQYDSFLTKRSPTIIIKGGGIMSKVIVRINYFVKPVKIID